MKPENRSAVNHILPETTSSPVTIDLKRTNVKMYILSEERLEMLSSGYNSVHLAFCTLMIGIFVALAITLSTIDLTNAPHKYAAYWVGFWVSLGLSVYFGIMATVGVARSKRQIQAIRQETLLEAKART
jgi:hypothetical protein